MSEFTIIFNPAAGKGSAQRAAGKLRDLLNRTNLDHVLISTEGPGHATEIARSAPGPFVVAAGGDGTLNEIANALHGTQKVLGVIPMGSGNDFIKSAGIPRRLPEAIELLHARRIRRIDAGRVTLGIFDSGSMRNAPGRIFLNGVGVGFDAMVAHRTTQIAFLHGTPLYLLAVFQTLGSFRAPHFHIHTDSLNWESRHLLVATGNGKCAGGGFYLTPEAEIDDGLLDVCAIRDMPVMKILRMIPAVMSKKRIEDTGVAYAKTRNLHLTSADAFAVHADGEVLGKAVNEVKIEALAGGLQILV